MYAVVRSGNKQFPVRIGTVLKVDRIANEAGSSFTMDDVVFAVSNDNAIISSTVAVTATVLEHRLDEKIIVFKKKRRKNHRRKRGFRHSVTILRIQDIVQEQSASASPGV